MPRNQDKHDREVNKLYSRYQTQGGFPKKSNNKMSTTAEIFNNTFTMLLLFGSVFVIVYSVMVIREANLNIRETEVNLYENEELLWNQTYRHQLQSLNISLIQDTFLYDRNINDIETKEILIEQLQKKLKTDRSVQG